MIKDEDVQKHQLHSPDLQAVLVEQILQTCISESSFTEIEHILEEMKTSLSTNCLKEHLFYLIEHYFIIYHGNNRVFVLTGAGLGL